MNRIVLIGNGFDLAHKLPTSYKDFINWYWDYRLRGLIDNQANVSEDILCKMTCLEKLWTGAIFFDYDLKYSSGIDIYNHLKSNDKEYKIEFSPLFERIMTSVETKGWVDIENEYYSLLVLLHSHKDNYSNHNKQLEYLRDLLVEYLSKIDYDKILKVNENIKYNVYKPLDPYNDYSLGDIDKYRTDPRYDMLEDVMLLSFNYTKTPELYKEDNTIIDYIHGKLDNPQSIIFGYGDELDEGYKKLINKNDNECLRNIKSIKYLESDRYREVLRFIESKPFQILIMGHSCGNSDRTLLNTLFEHRNCISIKPYYYIKEDGTDNFLELVQNISRSFTDMKLMRDRVVNKTYCETLTG